MTKVLVTGVNGYLGPHVVEKLLAKKCLVFGVSRSFSLERSILSSQNFIPIQKDIFESSSDFYQLAGKPDACIHLAWQDGFVHNSPAHISNLSNHFIFLKKLIDSGLKSLAVLGSMHEIGYWEGKVSENTPCNPSTLYGIAKTALRESLFAYCKSKGCSVKWLRAYYIYGDEERSKNIFAKILLSEKSGQKTFPFTTGTNLYDFIDIDELAEQIACSSLQNNIDGIIECCTGRPVSLATAVEQFIERRNLDIRLKYGAFPSRPYDSPGLWGDDSKIRKILNNSN